MSEEPGLKSVPVAMSPIAQYFVGRLLMLRERLTYEQWSSFDRSADVICNSILKRMPVDHPESAGLGQPPQGRSRRSAVISRKRFSKSLSCRQSIMLCADHAQTHRGPLQQTKEPFPLGANIGALENRFRRPGSRPQLRTSRSSPTRRPDHDQGGARWRQSWLPMQRSRRPQKGAGPEQTLVAHRCADIPRHAEFRVPDGEWGSGVHPIGVILLTNIITS